MSEYVFLLFLGYAWVLGEFWWLSFLFNNLLIPVSIHISIFNWCHLLWIFSCWELDLFIVLKGLLSFILKLLGKKIIFPFPSVLLGIVVAQLLSPVIPWTAAHQASLTMGFSRQEYWSRLPLLLQGIFPTQRSNSTPLADSLPLRYQGSHY